MIRNVSIILFCLLAILAGVLIWRREKPPSAPTSQSIQDGSSSPASSGPVTASPGASETPTALGMPLSRANERITKKPFGIYITPQTSPVQPERFSGYHTGVDFETFPEEQNTPVAILAVCDGALIYRQWVSGYGGVAIQRCALDGQPVTVLYGHLNLASVAPAVGAVLHRGEAIGNLGQGYSHETDGERKHLHLGIHKGTAINLRGYVSVQAQLSDWLDAAQYL